MADKLKVTCTACSAGREVNPTVKGNPRPPRGWKTKDDGLVCSKCWKKLYVLRAITLPLVKPLDMGWKELRVLLREAWAQSTAVANWITTECYARDIKRTPGMEKLPAWEIPYLYPDCKERFPIAKFGGNHNSQLLCSIEMAVKLKYAKRRYEVIWTGQGSLPSARYPQPYPVHNATWKVGWSDRRWPVVTCTVAGQRIQLLLRGGKEWVRQMGQVGSIIDGTATRGEMAILKKHDGTVMVKMVAWLPRKTVKPAGKRLLSVRTGSDCFWYCVLEGRAKPHVYNEDQVRRHSFARQRRRGRLSEDLKFEKRHPKRNRKRIVAKGGKFSIAAGNWFKTFIQQRVSMLVKFATRQGVATLKYDDAEKGFCEEFPWYHLKEQLKNKCDESRIEFIDAAKEKSASARPEGAGAANALAAGQ